ncbi:MAG: hypothetical protein IJS22_06765 [Lachnospiraceae bacterium]|nr:hypothetical protein [Lachnospiraceae bacterium]
MIIYVSYKVVDKIYGKGVGREKAYRAIKPGSFSCLNKRQTKYQDACGSDNPVTLYQYIIDLSEPDPVAPLCTCIIALTIFVIIKTAGEITSLL